APPPRAACPGFAASPPAHPPYRAPPRARGGAPPPRGLHLVEGVAVAWGVWSRGRHGKTVWALVASRAP
ncbi:hypothetical protein ACFV87_06125, partial [Streptomyces mirabilis]